MANTKLFDADDQRYRITPSQQMLCSCLGALTTSTLACCCCYPPLRCGENTVRQLEFGESLGSDESLRKASTTKQLFQRIYRQQGIGGLFVGLVPRVAKIAPACAIMISSYEYGKYYFTLRNKQMLEET
ncbi:hypothetical protein GHT06_019087 [Daphnia sinensis]|uniref:Uncharacterized protein n=1 Tax=Daphnia sinensis TaxID=1820382 RepID=A0AAD5L9Y9_9CRUS|nr:hypothetical protein GHT06_019087 [Daphnia sinensis]